MISPNCGEEIDDHANFCPNCGTPFGDEQKNNGKRADNPAEGEASVAVTAKQGFIHTTTGKVTAVTTAVLLAGVAGISGLVYNAGQDDFLTADEETFETGEDGSYYRKTLLSLGDACYGMRQLTQAKGVYQEMLSVVEYLSAHFNPENYHWDLAASYDRLGMINKKEGHLDEAKNWYSKGLELNEKLNQGAGTIQARCQLYRDL